MGSVVVSINLHMVKRMSTKGHHAANTEGVHDPVFSELPEQPVFKR